LARERYLHDAGEETINQGEIKLTTKKEIRANYWYYHKWRYIIGILIVAFVGGIVYSIVSKVTPDYQVALLTSESYPESVTTQLGDYLSQFGEDLNGDGKVVVQVNNYQVMDEQAKESADPNIVMAETVKFTVDLSTYESAIFLTTEDTYDEVLAMGAVFTYLDDWTVPSSEAELNKDRMRRSWNDCDGLKEFSLDIAVENISIEEFQKLTIDPLGISLREIADTASAKDEKKVAYYEASRQLLERVLNGE